jgi:hypothetical protein
MILTVICIIIGICWLGIGLWGNNVVKLTIKKFSNYQKIDKLDHKFAALYQDDYTQWNLTSIKIGCFILLPFRVIAFSCLIIGGVFFSFLLKIFG